MDFYGIFKEMFFFDLGSKQLRLRLRCQKKVSSIARQFLLCLKPFVVFFNLVED